MKWTLSTNDKRECIMEKEKARKVNRYSNEFKLTAIKISAMPCR